MNIDIANKQLKEEGINELLTIKTVNGKTHIETEFSGSKPESLNIGNHTVHLGPYQLTQSQIVRISSWALSTGSGIIWFGYEQEGSRQRILIRLPLSTATDEQIRQAVQEILEVPIRVAHTKAAFGMMYLNQDMVQLASEPPRISDHMYDMRRELLVRVSSRTEFSSFQLAELLFFFRSVDVHGFKLGVSETNDGIVVRLEGEISAPPADIKRGISRITSIAETNITLQIIP